MSDAPLHRSDDRKDGARKDSDPRPTITPAPTGDFEARVDSFSFSDTHELSFLAPAQQPGELGRLGGYRILRVLGRGGMGMVLHAEDIQLRRPVALKVMSPGLAAEKTSRQRFLREAQAAAALHHDHIVTIYQVGEDRGVPFLAMELLEGETLHERLKNEGRCSAAEVVRIGREMAEGLAAAHARGLVHRDIKPANIWLEKRGVRAGPSRVKILDFGLAHVAAADAAEPALTASGMVVGTPQYMAPEQAAGDKVDHRCDLFSLGCVLYEMAAGKTPFAGDSMRAVLSAVMFGAPPRLEGLATEVPTPLADLIRRLMAKEPKERPAMAGEVADALRAMEAELQRGRDSFSPGAAGGIGHRKQGENESRPLSPLTRRRFLLGAGTLGIVSLAGYLLYPTARPPDSSRPDAGVPALAVTAKLPFTILSGDGKKKSDHAILAQAVEAAANGDTIEIHADGPPITRPIKIIGKALTIRAAPGAAPTLLLKREAADSPLVNVETDSPLTLEGLSFHFIDRVPMPAGWYWYMLKSEAAPLRVAGCKFLAEIQGSHAFLMAERSPQCEVRNCQAALTHGGAALLNWWYPSNGQLVLENNVIAGLGNAVVLSTNGKARNAGFQVVRNSMAIPAMVVRLEEDASTIDKAEHSLCIDARENVLSLTLSFGQHQSQPADTGAEAGALLKRLVAWHEQRNAYASNAQLLFFAKRGKPIDTVDRTKLADWNAFWGVDNTGSRQGVVAFQGGDLGKKAQESPAALVPADFRLAKDSIGKGAGSDGKDLGADVDLVGPGPAYERWKQTTEYQQWRKDTGQQSER